LKGRKHHLIKGKSRECNTDPPESETANEDLWRETRVEMLKGNHSSGKNIFRGLTLFQEITEIKTTRNCEVDVLMG